jgi:hypothetical protein
VIVVAPGEQRQPGAELLVSELLTLVLVGSHLPETKTRPKLCCRLLLSCTFSLCVAPLLLLSNSHVKQSNNRLTSTWRGVRIWQFPGVIF